MELYVFIHCTPVILNVYILVNNRLLMNNNKKNTSEYFGYEVTCVVYNKNIQQYLFSERRIETNYY